MPRDVSFARLLSVVRRAAIKIRPVERNPLSRVMGQANKGNETKGRNIHRRHSNLLRPGAAVCSRRVVRYVPAYNRHRPRKSRDRHSRREFECTHLACSFRKLDLSSDRSTRHDTLRGILDDTWYESSFFSSSDRKEEKKKNLTLLIR